MSECVLECSKKGRHCVLTISKTGLAVIFAGYPFLVWSKVLIIFLALVFDTLQFS